MFSIGCEDAEERGESGGDDDGDAGACNTTDCWSECEADGYPGGACDENDTCVCEGEDTDTEDTDSDTNTGPDTGLCDVDILFVYDTSGSMMDAVPHLTNTAFPAFAEALVSYPSLGTIHVGVTTNLYGTHSFTDDEIDIQTSLLLTEGWPEGEAHDAFDCEEIPTVDCGFASGERWIEGPGETVLDEFACVGNVPCQQDVFAGEPTLQAGYEALRFDGNAGFVRDEALLVVVFITDEEDQSQLGAQAIRDGLLEIKDNQEEYVVVVTIAGPLVGTVEVNDFTGAMGCISPDYGGTEETPDIIAFTELFGERGRHYNMCEDDLTSALTDAFDRLALSCDEIIIE